MREPPSITHLQATGAEGEYDFTQAEQILRAMDFLRKEALKTGIDEIVTMVDASFRLLLTTYCTIMRYEMVRLLAESDDV